ncbi:MAG: cyclic pyranopterin monophosphate synthase MoaC [Firmicutes bacterium]|nr:cyclic pyranopterin monophosphate synthase MoaC [Bacillota bacterium]
MVEVGEKPVTARAALARGRLSMRPETLAALLSGRLPKGDAFPVARLAGIQAAKETSRLIPLCHPLPLTSVEVRLHPRPEAEPPACAPQSTAAVEIEAVARAEARTGVEMEALVAVTVAGLALYDMLKALDRDLVLGEVRLDEKSGGRGGDYRRGAAPSGAGD